MSSDGSDGGQLQYDVNDLTIYDFFNYWPSLALACVALALFTLAAAGVGWLTERRRAYRFVHLVTATGLMEMAGYAALIYAIERSGKSSVFSAYVAMQVFVIEAPNLVQAALYITIGKVLLFSPDLTRGRKMLRGWVIATTFAMADLFAIIVQAIGISIWASSQSSGTPDQGQIRLGCGITLAGLAIQLGSFICFTVLTIWTQRHPLNGLRGKRETRRLYQGVYLSMVGLYIRNIFRFAEFTQSTILTWPPPEDAYVLSEQQVLFYTLDALPILLVFVPYLVGFHPGYLLPDPATAPRPPTTPAAKAVAPMDPEAALPAGGSASSGSDGAKAGGQEGQGQQGQFKVEVLAADS